MCCQAWFFRDWCCRQGLLQAVISLFWVKVSLSCNSEEQEENGTPPLLTCKGRKREGFTQKTPALGSLISETVITVVVTGWACSPKSKAISFSPPLCPCPWPSLESVAGVHWRRYSLSPHNSVSPHDSQCFSASQCFTVTVLAFCRLQWNQWLYLVPAPPCEWVSLKSVKGLGRLGWKVLQKCHTVCDVAEGIRGNLNTASKLVFPASERIACLSVWDLLNMATLPMHSQLCVLSTLLGKCCLTQAYDKSEPRYYLYPERMVWHGLCLRNKSFVKKKKHFTKPSWIHFQLFSLKEKALHKACKELGPAADLSG